MKIFFLSQDNLDVEILTGGLTPEVQTLEKVINKLSKAFFRDLYGQYMFTVQFLPSSIPNPPTRQLLMTRVAKAWEMVKVELVRKCWTACGYPPEDMPGTNN